MQRLADQVVDHVRSVVLGRVDVVDAELDRPAQYGPSRTWVAWWPEHAGTGELHGAVTHSVDRLVAEKCRRIHLMSEAPIT
jgi:hypothetical protein